MSDWDPGQYLRFEHHRLRAALELLDRVPPIPAEVVWDLGCGAGNVTPHLAARWPEAHITGLDSSREMLTEAPEIPGVTWREGHIESWNASDVDVAYANASLHWVDDHETLFPRLMGTLRRGGTLVVQMPRNFDEPSHRVLSQVAVSSRWSGRVGHLAGWSPVSEPTAYYDLLAPLAVTTDIWEATYLQVLEGEDAVAEWVKGAGARRFLDLLGAEGDAFFTEYAERVRAHYPPRPDGRTVYPFRRLFIVATR